jgi:hypothetical protein
MALAQQKSSAAIPVLREAQTHPDPFFHQSAANALNQFGVL